MLNDSLLLTYKSNKKSYCFGVISFFARMEIRFDPSMSLYTEFASFFVETNILPSFISSNYSDLIEEN